MTQQQIIASLVFVLTMLGIITEKVHRTVAALAGTVLLLWFHVLTIDQSISYIDFDTIGILIGMMLFVAVVKNSGIFEYIAIKAAKIAKGNPWRIMIAFALITAVLSAFLDNVTTVLLIGPMTLAITNMLKINPVPYLMIEALSSNVGGTATLIGDPPNIMIGISANLTFVDFITNTGLVAVIVLAVFIVIFYFIYGKSMGVSKENIEIVMALDEHKSIKDRALMKKSVLMMVFVIVAFIIHDLLGISAAAVALTAAAVMLLIGKQDADEMVHDVEWPTLLFFGGLFVIVGGLRETGVIDTLAADMIGITNGNMVFTMILVLWMSAIVSAFLDNIPFVATMIPMIAAIQASTGTDVSSLWWALSLGACLGGNGTMIGASANVIICGISSQRGHPISFKQFMKIGFPMMIVSVIIATGFLLIQYA